MTSRIRVLAALAVLVAAGSGPTCDLSVLDGFLGFLPGGVTVVVENDTSYTASPRLWTGQGRNIVEDLIEERDDAAFDGEIAPKQSVTLHFNCDGGLEVIGVDGAQFRQGSGFAVGEVDDLVRIRRDVDFDCGDVVHVVLKGTVFNFHIDVDVEQVSAEVVEDTGDSSEADDGSSQAAEDIADTLDDLFGDSARTNERTSERQ